MKKSKIETNLKENRITLVFAKILTKKDLDSVYTDVRFTVNDLKPDFNVISNFSETKFLYLNALGVFRKIFNFILSNDCGDIVRVIQDNRIIHKQLLNLALRVPGHVPNYAPTIDEAEAKLKKQQKRDGLRFNLLKHPVELTIESQTFHGTIRNISTSGSVIITNNVLKPEKNSIVEVIFKLQDSKKEEINFSIKSRVVRTENDLFAVTFINVDESTKKILWNCIVVSGN